VKFNIGDKVTFSAGDICEIIDYNESDNKYLLLSETWRGGKYDVLDGYFTDSGRSLTLYSRKIKDTKLARKMYTEIHTEKDGFIWVN
jgi:hypothetical protein